MDFTKAPWFDGGGTSSTFSKILEKLRCDQKTHEIHVGTDSQPIKEGYVFATVICAYLPGGGAYYFVSRHSTKEKKYKNLGVRLNRESELSIILADLVRNNLSNPGITVHADVSPDPINKSSKYTKQIQNFIKSMGFECMVKPDSWASFVADKHAK